MTGLFAASVKWRPSVLVAAPIEEILPDAAPRYSMWNTPPTTTTDGLNASGHSQRFDGSGCTGGVRIGFPEYRVNGPMAHPGNAVRAAADCASGSDPRPAGRAAAAPVAQSATTAAATVMTSLDRLRMADPFRERCSHPP